jgi:hypothetical protein
MAKRKLPKKTIELRKRINKCLSQRDRCLRKHSRKTCNERYYKCRGPGVPE